MKLSRRKLLKMGLGVAGGSSLAQFIRPSVLFAEIPPGSSLGGVGQFLIHIVAAGGLDGQFAFPAATSAEFAAYSARRPDLLKRQTIDGSGRPTNDSSGNPNFVNLGVGDVTISSGAPLGLHPVFSERNYTGVRNVRDIFTQGHGRIVGGVGLATQDGSHDHALASMYVGNENWTPGTALHWVSRMMDAYPEMVPQRVWRLGIPQGLPFARGCTSSAECEPAITLKSIDDFTWASPGAQLGGSDEARRAITLGQRLMHMRSGRSGHAQDLVAALDQSVNAADQIYPFRLQATRAEYASQYGPLGTLFRDAARIIKRTTALGHTSKIYIQIALGGFDHHALLVPQLNSYLRFLNGNLGVLREDIGTAWAKTAVVMSSEFGRTIAQTGGAGADHGWSNHSFVLSGGLRGATPMVVGGAPNASFIANTSNNMINPSVNPVMPIFEILEWMGFDPQRIFPGFAPAPGQFLNLFSAH